MANSDDQLQEFKDWVRATNGLVLWSVGAGIFGALVGYFVELTPPWPDYVTPITCAVVLLVFMYVFLSYRRTSRLRARRDFLRAALCLVTFLIVYLFFDSTFVFEANASDVRLVTGYRCTIEAAEQFANCPFLTLDQVASAQFDPDLLWTKSSLSIVRLAIFLNWIGFFCSFVFAVALFVLYAKGRRP